MKSNDTMQFNHLRICGLISIICAASLFLVLYIYLGRIDFMKLKSYPKFRTKHILHTPGNITLSVNKSILHCNVVDLNTRISGVFRCKDLKFTPITKVCLYPVGLDEHISWMIEQKGMWEKHIVDRVLLILNHDRLAGLLDIGANIGVYSLLSARLGHRVVAVEPYTPNVMRMRKAVQLSRLQRKVTLLLNAVSDTRETRKLILSKRNQGDIRVSPLRSHGDVTVGSKSVKSIHLNDLLEVITFPRAVMKIDIQGYEHRAFMESSHLLEQVNVTCIFMEWLLLKSACNERNVYRKSMFMELSGMELKQSDKAKRLNEMRLVYAMMDILSAHGYSPYSLTGEVLSRHSCGQWPHDIVWVRKDQNQIVQLLKAFRDKKPKL